MVFKGFVFVLVYNFWRKWDIEKRITLLDSKWKKQSKNTYHIAPFLLKKKIKANFKMVDQRMSVKI